MSISVWSVRVDGLSEKPERTTLPSRVAPAIAWKRISAVSFSWMKYEASSGTPTNTRTGSICSSTNRGRPFEPPPGWR